MRTLPILVSALALAAASASAFHDNGPAPDDTILLTSAVRVYDAGCDPLVTCGIADPAAISVTYREITPTCGAVFIDAYPDGAGWARSSAACLYYNETAPLVLHGTGIHLEGREAGATFGHLPGCNPAALGAGGYVFEGIVDGPGTIWTGLFSGIGFVLACT